MTATRVVSLQQKNQEQFLAVLPRGAVDLGALVDSAKSPLRAGWVKGRPHGGRVAAPPHFWLRQIRLVRAGDFVEAMCAQVRFCKTRSQVTE